MDISRIIEFLQKTLVPETQKEGEHSLNEVQKILGFCPLLLQISMTEEVGVSTRQSAAIYLKNSIVNNWSQEETDSPADPMPFCIHENDKQILRESIVLAIVSSPQPIQAQLRQGLQTMVRSDLSNKWSEIGSQILTHISSPDPQISYGGYLCMHTLVKPFEYHKRGNMETLNSIMTQLLPIAERRISETITLDDEASVVQQKVILKILHTYTQRHLCSTIIDKQRFSAWITILRAIIERPIPQHVSEMDTESQINSSYWKCKKWATRLLRRYSERYGSPHASSKKYKEFSDWFVRSFSAGNIAAIFKVFEEFRQSKYITPVVLQQSLNYIENAIYQSFSWKFLSANFMLIVQDIIFPLCCHSEEDELLWEEDPVEYARSVYDMLSDEKSSGVAAELLVVACSKRKGILDKVMAFLTQLLNNPGETPKRLDGAFQMIGHIAHILMKNKTYSARLEMFIVNSVLPTLKAAEGYRRARGCWLLLRLSEAKLQSNVVVSTALALKDALVADTEIPVRIAAANALQSWIEDKEECHDSLTPYLAEILKEYLALLRKSEMDDLNMCMQSLLSKFRNSLAPLISETAEYLVETFKVMIQKSKLSNADDSAEGDTDVLKNGQSADGNDDDDDDLDMQDEVTIMGLLSTMERIVTLFENENEVLNKIEGTFVGIVAYIFRKKISAFYEEALSLVSSLSGKRISPVMWEFLTVLTQSFDDECFDYLQDMMPLLVNYVSIDTETFLSQEVYPQGVCAMAEAVLKDDDAGEDNQANAAKLIEILIINCGEKINQLLPRFLELAIIRLTRPIAAAYMRHTCLSIIIASLYVNTHLTIQLLSSANWPGSETKSFDVFLVKWIENMSSFQGVHDRKLSLLGVCALLNLKSNERPETLQQNGSVLLTKTFEILEPLEKAYQRANDSGSESSSNSDEEESDFLESDEDVIDDDAQSYADMLNRMDDKNQNGTKDVDENGSEGDDEDFSDECQLEEYESKIDAEGLEMQEFVSFYNFLAALESADPAWYQLLTANITSEVREQFKNVLSSVSKTMQAKESKKLEKAGGYKFESSQVPATFNFGGFNGSAPVVFSPPQGNSSKQS